MRPDRIIAEAWQQFSLTAPEASIREFADAIGRSAEAFAEGLRMLADVGDTLSEVEEPCRAA